MKLVIGVGNPGRSYANTLLNAGTIVIDKIAGQLANIHPRLEISQWKTTSKYMLLAIKLDPIVLLIKPRVFLNQLPSAVRHLANFYLKDIETSELNLSNLSIVHFDLGLNLGKFEVDRKSARNSYVQAIEKELSSTDFWKVRVGVARPGERSDESTIKDSELQDTELALLRKVGDDLIDELGLRVS